ncbi:MAG: hypothetical protein Q9182_000017 [Xanthomendoza sp. 2 TL-2023]
MTDDNMGVQLIERQTATPSRAKAFVAIPDQNWDGNDGSWSTFIIQVGTPPQYFRVLPSINGRETYIPLPTDCQRGKSWCGNARGVEPFKNPSTAVTLSTLDAGLTCSANKSPMCDNCISIEGHCTTGPCAGQYCCGGNPGSCNSAGCNGVSGICTAAYIGCNCLGDDYDVLSNKLHSPGAANPATATGFQFNQSSSWSVIGNRTLQGNSGMPKSSNGLFGMDIVAVGPNPEAALISSSRSTIAGIPPEPYYLGLLGLQPSNSSRFNGSSPSFLSNLKSQNLIPSLSFGYTAGAAYRSQGVLGSLTLGGYDRSKLNKNTVIFDINQDDSYALRAQIQSIAASNTLIGDVDLLSGNISAIIDSDLPYLQLPGAACKNFERAFGLSWDSDRELYLVNDTTHGKLRTSNPTIRFSFRGVNISFPYQAFDLQVTQPIAENGTNYFPLQCSSNSSQYILGRAFLQETYLFVDYEMSKFTISQAQFDNRSDIVTIDHTTSSQILDPATGDSSGARLSRGAIAGIAIGISVALVLLLSSLYFVFRRSKRRGQAGTTNRASISGPIPYESIKESWPTSPTGSGDHNTHAPMTAIPSESPIHRLEERLERLERANTQTELPEDSIIRSEMSGEDNGSHGPPTKWPKQELPGSPIAKELQEARMVGRDQAKRARHVFELAAEDTRRTSRKK